MVIAMMVLVMALVGVALTSDNSLPSPPSPAPNPRPLPPTPSSTRTARGLTAPSTSQPPTSPRPATTPRPHTTRQNQVRRYTINATPSDDPLPYLHAPSLQCSEAPPPPSPNTCCSRARLPPWSVWTVLQAQAVLVATTALTSARPQVVRPMSSHAATVAALQVVGTGLRGSRTRSNSWK